jgi:hypothetical protein
VSAAYLTDTPACYPRWGATTAGAARHPEQTVVRLLLLARLYVALQHCPHEHIFIPVGGLCPEVTVVVCIPAELQARRSDEDAILQQCDASAYQTALLEVGTGGMVQSPLLGNQRHPVFSSSTTNTTDHFSVFE